MVEVETVTTAEAVVREGVMVQTPTRHIGCICILQDIPLERPDPRVLRSNILNHSARTHGIKTLDSPTKHQKAIPENLSLTFTNGQIHT